MSPEVTTLIARLEQIDCPDPDEQPNLSPRLRDALATRARQRDALIRTLRLADDLRTKPSRQLDFLTTVARPAILAAIALYEHDLHAAPNHRSLPGVEATHEWRRQEALAADLHCLRAGCEFFNGVPNVTPLCLERLGGQWYGPLVGVDQRIAELTPTVREKDAQLADAIRSAEQFVSSVTAAPVAV